MPTFSALAREALRTARRALEDEALPAARRLVAEELVPAARRAMDRPASPVVARAVLPLPAEEAWSLLTDVRQHERWVPLTRIEAERPLGVGDSFTAVTGPTARSGGPGLVDRMTVLRSQAPSAREVGVARYRKDGPVLRGGAGIEVRALGPDWCEVAWTEEIGLRGLPTALTDLVSRPVSWLMLDTVLRRVRQDVREGLRSPRNESPS